MAVCGTTSDMEPNMPTATAAGSAVVSDDEVNSRKYAAAVAVRLAVSRFRSWMSRTVESMLVSAYRPSFVSRVRPSTLAKIASCATRGISSQIAEAATHRSAS